MVSYRLLMNSRMLTTKALNLLNLQKENHLHILEINVDFKLLFLKYSIIVRFYFKLVFILKDSDKDNFNNEITRVYIFIEYTAGTPKI